MALYWQSQWNVMEGPDEYRFPDEAFTGSPLDVQYRCLNCGELLRGRVSLMLRKEEEPDLFGEVLWNPKSRVWVEMEGALQHLC